MQLLRFGSKRASKTKAAELTASHLVSKLFGTFDGREGIAVLDAGTGTRSTLDFLNQYRCRVVFLDLFEFEKEPLADAAAAEDAAFNTFARMLAEYKDTLFDVCLFWDLLHRLDAPALRGLSNALRPYLYSESRGYGVCQLLATDQQRYTYRIANIGQLSVLPTQAPPVLGWSQTEFAQHFDCFKIVDDALSDTGRHEILLEAD